MRLRLPSSAELDRDAVARGGFRAFVRVAWSRVEQTPLVWNWHMDAICTHLEAVTRGEVVELVINVPPGHSKSLLTNVLWPAWEWSRDPGQRYICATFDHDLATRDARKMRTLVTSDWYTDRWPGVDIPNDRTASTSVTTFTNTSGGFRNSVTVRGAVLGKHAHKHIIDDPIDPQGAALASGVELDEVLRWHGETMGTRFVNPDRPTTVLIMQRIHMRDLAGKLISEGATVLCLPMRYESQHPHRWANRYGRDPRTTEGELLNPVRWPDAAVRRLEKRLGPYGTAAQLQQRPAPAEGGIFRKEWLQHYWTVLPSGGVFTISVDCAFKGLDDSDLVAFQCWYECDAKFYLVDRWTERRDFNTTCNDLVIFAARWKRATEKLIEGKANGVAVMNALERALIGMVEIDPEGGKESRAHGVVPIFAAGEVLLPHPERAEYPDGRRGAEWVRGGVNDLTLDAAEGSYEHTMLGFPKAAHDDDVDATTQYLNHAAGDFAARMINAFKGR